MGTEEGTAAAALKSEPNRTEPTSPSEWNHLDTGPGAHAHAHAHLHLHTHEHQRKRRESRNVTRVIRISFGSSRSAIPSSVPLIRYATLTQCSPTVAEAAQGRGKEKEEDQRF